MMLVKESTFADGSPFTEFMVASLSLILEIIPALSRFKVSPNAFLHYIVVKHNVSVD
jgi:hypothetical protein